MIAVMHTSIVALTACAAVASASAWPSKSYGPALAFMPQTASAWPSQKMAACSKHGALEVTGPNVHHRIQVWWLCAYCAHVHA